MPDFAMDDFDEALMHNDPDVSFSTPMPDAALDRDYLEFICSVKDNSGNLSFPHNTPFLSVSFSFS